MTHAAFLPAIIATPDDDTPRLICADWLDEHGQPERAEFIRVQCADAAIRRALADPEPLPDCIAQLQRLADLEKREAELLPLVGAWMEGITFDRSRIVFHRGFVERASCSFFTLHVLDAAFALQPMEEVKIDELEEPFRREPGESADQFRERVKREGGEQFGLILTRGTRAAAPVFAAVAASMGDALVGIGFAARHMVASVGKMLAATSPDKPTKKPTK